MPMTNNVNGDTRNYSSDSSGINGSPFMPGITPPLILNCLTFNLKHPMRKKSIILSVELKNQRQGKMKEFEYKACCNQRDKL